MVRGRVQDSKVTKSVTETLKKHIVKMHDGRRGLGVAHKDMRDRPFIHSFIRAVIYPCFHSFIRIY